MINSVQPRKQRKFRFTAPMHLRKKMVSAHVSKELAAKLPNKKRSLPLRKGDKVKVMRGEDKGKIGKVVEVELSTLKVYVEGVVNRTAKGVEKPKPIDPSNLLIIEAEMGASRMAMVARGIAKKKA